MVKVISSKPPDMRLISTYEVPPGLFFVVFCLQLVDLIESFESIRRVSIFYQEIQSSGDIRQVAMIVYIQHFA